MDKRMLINAVETEECRIAILENNVLEELYIERSSRGQIAGNIYKGKVVNVESSIEAAFIDIGLKKNGFLHVSDVLPHRGSESSSSRARSAGSGNEREYWCKGTQPDKLYQPAWKVFGFNAGYATPWCF